LVRTIGRHVLADNPRASGDQDGDRDSRAKACHGVLLVDRRGAAFCLATAKELKKHGLL
jgi:hypothetical protein